MAFVNKEEYLRMQQERQARAQAAQNGGYTGPRVGYFSLKDDGDEALVRFNYKTADELWNDVMTVHSVTIDGKFRKVNCIRSMKDPIDTCPLCASGQSFQQRVYIKLIEYVREEDGTITASPKVWERPMSYVQILTNLFTEYGDISENVFKVKRSGERGSMQTTYNIMLGNPSIYNAQLYAKDFSAFEGYKILGGPVMDKTYTELQELVQDSTEVETPFAGQTFAQPTPTPVTNQTFTPQSQQAPVGTPAGGQRRITY